MSDKLQIYSAAIGVQESTGRVSGLVSQYIMGTCAVSARSDAEAVGMALQFAREKWKGSRYSGFQATVFAVPHEWIFKQLGI